MTVRGVACAASLLLACAVGCDRDGSERDVSGALSPEARSALARCLTENGWVMYSSITCSACRTQREAFGNASALIREIECNPHAQNTEVERCLARGIRKTPTWVQERDGSEVGRIEGYHVLEDLAAATGCAPKG